MGYVSLPRSKQPESSLKLLLGSLRVQLVVTYGLAGSQGHNSQRSGHT